MNLTYSVAELSQLLKACFEREEFNNLSVYGEVYSIRLGKFSYIELGDQGNKQTNSPLLKCAFSTFYGNDYHLEEIKVGDVIQITGRLSYYPHGSSITLWGNEVEILRSQEGKNLLAKKKTLEKLDKLGYLDEKRKRKIPRYCKKIAILTAETGAAYQDILKTLKDRFPVSSVLYPVVVQGDNAAKSIVSALKKANEEDYDAILLGRGGGSKTDLSCFDDEKVALSIATSKIPVITCIGHTIDTAIADRVSDVKAITPTEAASLINPSKEEIASSLEEYKSELNEAMKAMIRMHAQGLEHYKEQLDAYSPINRVLHKKEKNELFFNSLTMIYRHHLRNRKDKETNFLTMLKQAMANRIDKSKMKNQNFISLLKNVSPETIAKKGYAVLYKEGIKITSSKELKEGDKVQVTYPDGRIDATIESRK